MAVIRYPLHLATFAVLALALGATVMWLVLPIIGSNSSPKSHAVLPRMIEPPAGLVPPAAAHAPPYAVEPKAFSRSNDGTIVLPDRMVHSQPTSQPL